MQIILEDFKRPKILWKSKKVWKRKFNNISRQLEVLVYSFKGSEYKKLDKQMSVDIKRGHKI